MSTIVSPAMRTFLRSQVARQFTDSVEILNRVVTQNEYGEDATYSSATVTDGWLRQMNRPGLDGQVTGAIAAPGIYRLLLPYNTVVGVGDRVIIGGQKYEVQDTSSQDSNNVSLVVTVRRLETE